MSKQLLTKEFPFTMTKMDGEAGTFSGYLSVFDVEDSYGDTVIKGAFKRTLRNTKDFPLLWSHDVTQPIGGFTGKEDATGLLIEGKLTLGVQRANEVRALMMDKVVKGLSIGYQTVKEEIDNKNGKRKLLELKLWEGSVCVFPANPASLVTDIKGDELDDEDAPPIQYCEHCAKALDEEGSGEPTPPEDPPIAPVNSNPEQRLHLLESLKLKF